MILSLTIFLASLIIIAVLITNKVFELEKGRAFIIFHRNADHKVKGLAIRVKTIVKKAPKEIGRMALYIAIKKGVEVGERLKNKVYPRISHIVDAVKGRDLPKNRGKASFFLEKISNDLNKKD